MYREDIKQIQVPDHEFMNDLYNLMSHLCCETLHDPEVSYRNIQLLTSFLSQETRESNEYRNASFEPPGAVRVSQAVSNEGVGAGGNSQEGGQSQATTDADRYADTQTDTDTQVALLGDDPTESAVLSQEMKLEFEKDSDKAAFLLEELRRYRPYERIFINIYERDTAVWNNRQLFIFGPDKKRRLVVTRDLLRRLGLKDLTSTYFTHCSETYGWLDDYWFFYSHSGNTTGLVRALDIVTKVAEVPASKAKTFRKVWYVPEGGKEFDRYIKTPSRQDVEACISSAGFTVKHLKVWSRFPNRDFGTWFHLPSRKIEQSEHSHFGSPIC
uniref:Uncharacterized protein n=1 Tax=Chromera velia CCMP2878 TaxID=1169474 RepID=A0A0G4GH25_9ALVE|mmetsp:Transcript_34943/g.68970  ORF Transcript_34943/g.68970 Transcript_34943/m.68970 type:complete len:327 (-) Transcript_34943:671-1651(-)|eukprot:Cvel_21875.t1-p1 / transcript=Cvel_21875.t1 / gene=Cvel_21875 / organism=Chromera_velia_CCMP2878 / gene_product=hypothetical protein / transcript_product=hypothetical protein / location=Cvel_scaffold2091:9378-12457(+) / protein_length=326 / sequence_SO=supercontig / SO=protein_coding / is_pseudo=false